jgi:hypothetical protein
MYIYIYVYIYICIDGTTDAVKGGEVRFKC